MAQERIPGPLLAACAEIAANRETHATLDSLFTYAGASGRSAPDGSKHAKALAWLRITNMDDDNDPLWVLGRIIENYMEEPLDPQIPWQAEKIKDRERISNLLSQCNLQYVTGGKIIGALGVPSRSLEEYIKDGECEFLDIEFNRALSNVEANPREAVSAASNIIETACKTYIAEEGLEMPAKQDLPSVWMVVRKHLGLDPSVVEEQDFKKILSGLISITDGIGALRTHASSAHGAGKKIYRIEPRHARLAIHSAHTVVLFIMESWRKKKQAI